MILKKYYNQAHECIVKEGDPGIAMYILVKGTARYTKGSKWMPEGIGSNVKNNKALQALELSAGSSFGEEIIFGFLESYSYTIVSTSECSFHTVSEDDFTEHFKNMPDLRDRMLNNFMQHMQSKAQVVDVVEPTQDS